MHVASPGDIASADTSKNALAGPFPKVLADLRYCTRLGREAFPSGFCRYTWYHFPFIKNTAEIISASRARMALGWTRKKKTLIASGQNEAERVSWREQAKALPTQDLVIVDETGSRINMTPLYAYAPRGKRAIGNVP